MIVHFRTIRGNKIWQCWETRNILGVRENIVLCMRVRKNFGRSYETQCSSSLPRGTPLVSAACLRRLASGAHCEADPALEVEVVRQTLVGELSGLVLRVLLKCSPFYRLP